MSELRVPLDYEQLAEVSQLRSALRTLRAAASPDTAIIPREIEQAASFLFHRLWVTLGYLARSTNKPGKLTGAGALQLRESVEPLYGNDCDVVQLLEACGLLTRVENFWQCALFATLNEPLAGNFRPAHQRGNDGRQVSLALRAASSELAYQMVMLTGLKLEKADGSKFGPQEMDRAVMLIGTFDRIFKFTRHGQQITQAMIRTAAEICERHDYKTSSIPEKLREFMVWLVVNREKNPRIPQTTEQLLADFDLIYTMSHGHA